MNIEKDRMRDQDKMIAENLSWKGKGVEIPILWTHLPNLERRRGKNLTVVIPGLAQETTNDPIADIGMVTAQMEGQSIIVGYPKADQRSNWHNPDFARQPMVEAINAMIKKLDARSLIFVGFSVGGIYAVILAKGLPVSKIEIPIKGILTLGSPSTSNILSIPYFEGKLKPNSGMALMKGMDDGYLEIGRRKV